MAESHLRSLFDFIVSSGKMILAEDHNSNPDVYLKCDNPLLKGKTISVNRDIVKGLINEAIKTGKARHSFRTFLDVDSEGPPNCWDYHSWETHSQYYSGITTISLNFDSGSPDFKVDSKGYSEWDSYEVYDHSRADSVIMSTGDPNWFLHNCSNNNGRSYFNISISKGLAKIISDKDFLLFKETEAKLVPSDPRYPNSHPPNIVFPILKNSKDNSYQVVLHWLAGSELFSPFKRWIALRQSREKCSFCGFEGERYNEARLMNDYCRKKLIEGFEIPQEEFPLHLEEIDTVEPALLYVLSRGKLK